MLSDVKAIVAAIYQVSIVQYAGSIEYLDNSLHEFVDGLKCAESQAVELIVVLNLSFIVSGQLTDPAGTARL